MSNHDASSVLPELGRCAFMFVQNENRHYLPSNVLEFPRSQDVHRALLPAVAVNRDSGPLFFRGAGDVRAV